MNQFKRDTEQKIKELIQKQDAFLIEQKAMQKQLNDNIQNTSLLRLNKKKTIKENILGEINQSNNHSSIIGPVKFQTGNFIK